MHEKVFKNSQIFAVNFAIENIGLFIFDSYSAQIHKINLSQNIQSLVTINLLDRKL